MATTKTGIRLIDSGSYEPLPLGQKVLQQS